MLTVNYHLTQGASYVKKTSLKISIKYKNNSYHYTLPIRLYAYQWNEDLGQPSNIYLKKLKELNILLIRLKIALFEAINQKRLTVNFLWIRRFLKDFFEQKNKVENDTDTLEYWMQLYIQGKQNRVKHNTFKRYKVFYHQILRFEGFIGRKIRLSSLSQNLITQFEQYIQQEQYQSSTAHRTLVFIRTILFFAKKREMTFRMHHIEWELEKESIEQKVILNHKELQRIEEQILPPDLERVKDWLLISCYTGQRVSDFMKFTQKNIQQKEEEKYLDFVQQKTMKRVLLPIHPVVEKIIEKYQGTFPKPLTELSYNKQLKQLGKTIGLTQCINSRKRIQYRAKEGEYQKWELLSSHIGRRSFATNFYGKIPTALLISATGHSTEKMFLRYINQLDTQKTKLLDGYFRGAVG